MFEEVPVKLAVIVPAEKLPEPSRATMVEAVFAFVASEVMVTPAVPLYEEPPDVRCVPKVRLLRLFPRDIPLMVELARYELAKVGRYTRVEPFDRAMVDDAPKDKAVWKYEGL